MKIIDLDDDRNCYIGSDGEYERWNIDPDAIMEQPEIVRCKDCRYWEETMSGKGCCKDMYGFGRWWKDNDFCSRAERREE